MSSASGERPSYRFAYYCSGHGFGHATRVTAISLVLLSRRHTVYLVSSARESVFSPVTSHCSGKGSYRYAQIEPIVVQPKAYDVDRRATFQNLERFLANDRSRIIDEERRWLIDQGIQCVLVDAPFLPCGAAREANIPSVIISNFTFDSCYSYLSSINTDVTDDGDHDVIDPRALNPLVDMTVSDYSKAELLLRLPGAIPIPSFDTDVELPATKWVNLATNSFAPQIDKLLDRPTEEISKQVIDIPLVVRPVSKGIHQAEKKLDLLKSLQVPKNLEVLETKILLVSFGGQFIPRPKPPGSTASNPSGSPSGVSQTSDSDVPGLLPPGWIAIVCGLSADFISPDTHDRFYTTTKKCWDYVPDLTAVADVVLGKLGYGTCSESLATMTPFVHVPRPMFVEEYGLKRLMRAVTNIEMSRSDFENGCWSHYIRKAEELGRQAKQDFISRQGMNNASSQKGDEAAQVVVDQLEQFLVNRS